MPPSSKSVHLSFTVNSSYVNRRVLQAGHDLLRLLHAGFVVPGGGEIGDLRPVRRHRIGIGVVAEIDALGFHQLRGGEDAGAGGRMTPVGASSLARKTTPGVTYSGFSISSICGGIRFSVMRVAATGQMALTLMLFFAPSSFSVFMKPTRPSLAAP